MDGRAGGRVYVDDERDGTEADIHVCMYGSLCSHENGYRQAHGYTKDTPLRCAEMQSSSKVSAAFAYFDLISSPC